MVLVWLCAVARAQFLPDLWSLVRTMVLVWLCAVLREYLALGVRSAVERALLSTDIYYFLSKYSRSMVGTCIYLKRLKFLELPTFGRLK